MRRVVLASLSVSLLVAPMLSSAARFPDVPSDHPYSVPVEALAVDGVITGNPDGNFYPARPVNRAEFLTMLYRARKIETRAGVSCFADVAAGAWYAAVVCDASARGYVGGYPDGKFRPEQTVNRVEALKMITKVYGFAVLTGSAANEATSRLTDVQADAWYTTYVSTAYKNGLLPIAGYSGSKFYPESALLRGEAAAYIWKAMNISNVVQGASSSAATRSSARSRSSSSAPATTKSTQVDFPFSDNGTVGALKTIAYTFPLSAQTSLQIDVSLGASASKGVSCRLYLLGENGLSEQYYLGYEESHSCHLRVTVPKGDYQLEVKPEDPNTTYDVFTKKTSGDGNDGFSEAILLPMGQPKVGQLAVGDIADWYKFSLATEGTHTVQTVGDDLSCLIYALDDVDLFGFSGPVCGESYVYPEGSYIVRVQRQDNRPMKLDYSVRVD